MASASVFPEEFPTETDHYKLGSLSPDLENGPITKRSFTNIIPCLLLLICFAGIVTCTAYVIIYGKPSMLGRPYDSDGKLCGIDAGYENFPYLYYPVPDSNIKTVCVTSCPGDPPPATVPCKVNSVYSSCEGKTDGSFYSYKTATFFGRLCIPLKSESKFAALTTDIFTQDVFEKWVGDLKITWTIILFSVVGTALIGIILTSLMYCYPALIFYLMFCLAFILTAGSGFLLIYSASTTEDKGKKIENEEITQKKGCWTWTKDTLMCMNTNAIIQVALTGKSFMPAARDAYALAQQNPVNLGVLSDIGGIFIFYGKIFLASLAFGASLVFQIFAEDLSSKIYSPMLTSIVIFFFVYALGSGLMVTYGMTADTMVVCYIIEEGLINMKNMMSKFCPKLFKLFMLRAKRINRKL